MLAWRFETYDINGAWSDSYVLRHKLNSLLTLFFVGSVLLVVTNIALASAMNWTGNVLDIVSAATPSAATPSDSGGNQPASSRGSRAGAGKGDQTANPTAKSDPIAAEFSSLKTLKTSIVSFAGALGSLILILIFTPALYGITSEIEIAGKTHASYNMAGASAAPPPAAAPTAPIIVLAKESIADDRRSYELEIIADAGAAKGKPGLESKTQPVKVPDVAGWKTVQNWKEKHGLKLSFSDFTGGFIAALAPLLSGSVVDLTKMTMGAIS